MTIDAIQESALIAAQRGITFNEYVRSIWQMQINSTRLSVFQVKELLIKEGIHLPFKEKK